VVDGGVAGAVECGERGAYGDGLAGADSDGDRLQLLRETLPCEITVVASTHPLCGERLAASSFRRRDGVLQLLVILPDGSPALIDADVTDVLGASPTPETSSATVLSAEGVGRLRVLVEAQERNAVVRPRRRGRPKPWKVVRHAHGVDPFEQREWVYSSHTTELAARRARGRVKAVMVRASGWQTAAAWAWSVVYDPAGQLPPNPPAVRFQVL
jgi:hypothetical protein